MHDAAFTSRSSPDNRASCRDGEAHVFSVVRMKPSSGAKNLAEDAQSPNRAHQGASLKFGRGPAAASAAQAARGANLTGFLFDNPPSAPRLDGPGEPYIYMAYTRRAGVRISRSGGAREAKLFRNNRSQAVRIPAEFELPGDRVLISRDGDRLIIEPAPKGPGLIALLDGWEPLAEDFPDVDEHLPPLSDVAL
jgi:antitoxin VapB